MIKLNTLKKNPKNPRVIKDAKFDKLKSSLEKYPEMMKLRPIVIDEARMILGGNMRYEALRSLGYKEIDPAWVIKASKMSEEQKRHFIITDNAPFGEWDWDVLANEWDELELEEWGIDLPPKLEMTDLAELFEDHGDEQKESKGKIVLEYTETDAALVRSGLGKIDKSPEQAVWKLLKL